MVKKAVSRKGKSHGKPSQRGGKPKGGNRPVRAERTHTKSRKENRAEKFKKPENENEPIIKPKFVEENEIEGNKVDFYLDDADAELADDDIEEENSVHSSGSEEDAGSELDFGEEDYTSSEGEADDDEEEENEKNKKSKKKKEKKITKLELKKIIKKCKEGVPMAITKMIIIFTKIVNTNEKVDSLDEDNIFNKPKIVQRLVKFSIKNLSEILVLKLHSINESGVKESSVNEKTSIIKNLIRRYLSTLVKYMKNTENSMLAFIYKNMTTISELIFLFKNFIEVILKFSIKVWASRHGYSTSTFAFRLIKEILQKKPENFENSLKYFYINYLEIAKACNWNTIIKIKTMQDEIIQLLALDLQKAYITIFTFIRKLCLQLRITINDRKTSSIKNIYNWQFINSLHLWIRVVSKYFSNKESEINLLAYPLIQTILGVLRLNLVDSFFPLRVFLINMLNELSHSSKIYTPVSSYLLEILESSHFKNKYKEKNVTKSSDDKDASPDIHVNLKFKDDDFKNYGYVNYLLEETLDSLNEFIALNSYKFSFPEIAFGVVYQLKKIAKNMMDKNLREGVKSLIEKIKAHQDKFELKRKESGLNLLQLEKIKTFENEMRTSKSNELIRFIDKVRIKRERIIESRLVQNENKFIEI